MSRSAYIYDAIRTPRGKGKADGALYEVKPVSLLSRQLETLAERNKLDTSRVSDVVIGCVSAVGEQGMNIAKAAVLAAHWHQSVAGSTVNRFCASGLEAINIAAARVASGFDELVVAGGVESMSRVPMGSDGGPWAFDPETNLAAGFAPQGIGADLIATIAGFSRDEVDQFALRSHQKAAAAEAEGRASASRIPFVDQNGIQILGRDELLRADASLAALGQLKPSFAKVAEYGFAGVAYHKYHDVERIQHVHTAGNSSGISDGAAVVLIGSEQAGRDLGLKAKARIVSAAVVGSEPTIMLTGPTAATRLALAKAGLTFADIDLFEVNEAFAAVVLRFQRENEIPLDKINVNGGAIALGHPLGATGAMLASTLIDELGRRNSRYGVVTLCIGAGMGIATVFERL